MSSVAERKWRRVFKPFAVGRQVPEVEPAFFCFVGCLFVSKVDKSRQFS